MKQSLLLFLLLILINLMSCSTSKKVDNNTYFGGEIINPSGRFVLLFKENKLIDSIPLNKKNQFNYQFKNFKKGLYTFRHDEYQYLYIEPTDSLFLRVNTIEFDETLTFSGKGADKNNFMIKTFLKNESESDSNRNLFQLTPEKFIQTTDSLLKEKHIALEKYASKYMFSEDFKNIANALVDYQVYGLNEDYVSANRKKDSFSLPKTYFDFRKDVNYNAAELLDFYPYYNYLNTFINNITNKNYTCKNSLETQTNKLKVIDSMINNPDIKDHLFQKIVFSYFHKKDTPANRKVFVQTLSQLSDNKELIKNITELTQKMQLLTVGTTLPDFEVIAPNHQKINFKELINKPTVLYFWTKTQPAHLKSVHEKIKQFSQSSPYQYIGICIDDNTENWDTILRKFKFNNDYLIVDPSVVSQKLMLQTIHKTFVLDTNGIILSNSLNIFDVKFKEKLHQL